MDKKKTDAATAEPEPKKKGGRKPMTPEEKAAVSHRGKALAVFEVKLREYLKGNG